MSLNSTIMKTYLQKRVGERIIIINEHKEESHVTLLSTDDTHFTVRFPDYVLTIAYTDKKIDVK